MADLYSTNVLIKVVESLIRPSSFLLDTFFPQIQTQATEEIHFDIINSTRRLAAFVSPVVAGKVVQEQGFQTETFKPAYLKLKTPLTAGGALKRSVGEQIGGSLSPQDRQMARVGMTIQDHIDQIVRRMEWMAAEALRAGQVTISGESYQTSVVNYGRDAGQTVVLTGGNRWGQAGISPLNLLQDWALGTLKLSGAHSQDVVMDIEAWKIFRADSEVQQRLETRRVNNNAMSMNAHAQVGGVYQGTVDGFNIFTYAEWYIDDAGVTQPMLPTGTVLMGGVGIEGVRAFGAILDDAAGLQAMEFFPKSWVPEDPAVRQVLTQSAPLVVPTRVNASFAATVI